MSKSILDKIVDKKKMPVLFIGSGISKRYLYNFPNWEELLKLSFSSESYNIAEIYKIHGSVLDAKSIIITESDYANFNASRKLIIAKMLTLFAESYHSRNCSIQSKRNKKNLNADHMCFDRFKSICTTHLIPVFKYTSKCTSPIPEDSKLNKYISERISIDKIISKSQLKAIHSLPAASTIGELHEAMALQNTLDKQAGVLLKSLSNLTLDEIRLECKVLSEKSNGKKITSTCLKRCIMYLDFMENCTKKVNEHFSVSTGNIINFLS